MQYLTFFIYTSLAVGAAVKPKMDCTDTETDLLGFITMAKSASSSTGVCLNRHNATSSSTGVNITTQLTGSATLPDTSIPTGSATLPDSANPDTDSPSSQTASYTASD